MPLNSKLLRDRTKQTATSFGAWLGTNEAIKRARALSAPLDDQVAVFLNDLALMTVVRVYALLERDAQISFQQAYRELKESNSENLRAVAPGPGLNDEALLSEIEKFQNVYGSIDWKIHGRLTSFRNLTVAHLSESEAKGVTYGNVHRLVVVCCGLSDRLSLIAEGLHSYEVEKIGEQAESSYDFWCNIIKHQDNIDLPDVDGKDWTLWDGKS